MKLFSRFAIAAIFLLARIVNAEAPPASFAYILQADAFAKAKPQAVERLATCGREWIVLDAQFSSDTPWTRADLDEIRHGLSGSK